MEPATAAADLEECSSEGGHDPEVYMSLAPHPHDLSNPKPYPWAIVIVILVMWLWPAAKDAVGIYADAVPVAALFAGLGTAAKYSNRGGRWRRLSALKG
ncbi:hypothetical protein [Streptomyces sp. NPDC005012]|uniref:hypothetical protein n=1 Tax=Streptomyces sp. NPDC005012 TaxID=3154558 RepID=UPI0033AF34F3